MSLIGLAWRYLWSRPLATALHLLLLSLGLAAALLVLLVGEQVEAALRRDLAGIDLVVGAKGSPMQIMLAGVFHLDQPTGNIPLAAHERLSAHPLVARSVPISLGDTLAGFRIVGTEAGFLSLYRAELAQGAAWRAPMQAVLGAEVARRTGLGLGSRFAGSHGLGGQGSAHAGLDYQVVGVLARSGGVLDRLVLTDLASVWQVHEQHHADSDAAAGAEHHDDAPTQHDGGLRPEPPARETTMLLISYRSPLAAISVPRWVNAQDGLQAAAPALETARLLGMIGIGADMLAGFAILLLLSAALSLLVALLYAVRERQPDLAMLRMLGAPAWRVALLLVLEALCLALLAALLGSVLAHGMVGLLGWALAERQTLGLSGLWMSPREVWTPVLAAALALLAAAWPIWRAYRLDVTELLQAPH